MMPHETFPNHRNTASIQDSALPILSNKIKLINHILGKGHANISKLIVI